MLTQCALAHPAGTKSLSTTAQSSKDQGWWLAARKGTPGAERVSHLNNAGSSLCPAHVMDPMLAYLQEEALRGGCVDLRCR